MKPGQGLTEAAGRGARIHGDMPEQAQQHDAEAGGGKLAVLIASDLASRGIDVDDISHVINLTCRRTRSVLRAPDRADGRGREVRGIALELL